MMRAIVEDDVEEILKILKNPRFDVNGPIDKKYGLTALQMASLINRFPTVELLLLYGANINLRDRHGNTPLILAVEKRNY